MIYVLKIVLSYYLILPYYQGFWLNLYIIIKDFERSKRQSWFRPNVVYRAPRGAKMASCSLCNRCYSYWNRHLDLPRMDHEQCLYVHEKERFLFFSNNVWLFRDMRWGYSSSTSKHDCFWSIWVRIDDELYGWTRYRFSFHFLSNMGVSKTRPEIWWKENGERHCFLC